MSLLKLFIIITLAVTINSCGRNEKNRDVPFDKNLGTDLTTPVTPAPTNKAVGGFRGYEATNRLINERFFRRDDAVALRNYIEETDTLNPFLSIFSPSLKDLLGVYEVVGINTEMKNNAPNGVNMLLWYLVFDGIANDLASVCSPENDADKAKFSQSDLKPEVLDVLTVLCHWPDAAALDDRNLHKLWDLGMQADAPESEFVAWRNYIQSPSFGATSGNTAPKMIVPIIVTMLYNPNFLLNK